MGLDHPGPGLLFRYLKSTRSYFTPGQRYHCGCIHHRKPLYVYLCLWQEIHMSLPYKMKYWRRIYIGRLADCSEICQYKIRQLKLHAARATPLCAERTYSAPKMAILRYFKRRNPRDDTALAFRSSFSLC